MERKEKVGQAYEPQGHVRVAPQGFVDSPDHVQGVGRPVPGEVRQRGPGHKGHRVFPGRNRPLHQVGRCNVGHQVGHGGLLCDRIFHRVRAQRKKTISMATREAAFFSHRSV